MEEERKKYLQFEENLEKERLEILSQHPSQSPSTFQLSSKLDSIENERNKKKEEIQSINKNESIENPNNEKLSLEKEEKKDLIVNPFVEKLEALKSMGFVDNERNLKLLFKYNGELLPVIQFSSHLISKTLYNQMKLFVDILNYNNK